MHPASPILLVTTGGTIASRRAADGAFVPSDTGAVLGQHLPGARHIEFAQVESAELRLAQVAALARLLQDEFDRGAARGAVVTHGTDTMEETALLLDLFVRSDAPVVITGAQLPADDEASDGIRNLIAAYEVAGSETARGLGTLLVFDGAIHAAAGVVKDHASALYGFRSLDGPIGHVDRGFVAISRRPQRLAALPIVDAVREVDIIQAGLDADGRLLRAALASGVRGLVLEALGRGNAAPDLAYAVCEACAAQIPVLLVSRCRDGRAMPLNVSGRAMQEAGAIVAGRWKATQARLLLAVALAVGGDVRQTLAPFLD